MKAPLYLLSQQEQFRMTRLQVFNWGTFGGVHDVPISERGFLIVGRSGAGKSTLLDAFSALLVPPRWIDFNAAAREADRAGRDRNLVSYVRGAWAAQSDASSGEAATRYLRAATTWSAIALNYHNANGRDVTLVQLFWLRGNSNANADVKRLFLVLERPFDVREIAQFGSQNFDVRKLKTALPDVFIRDEFRPYCERFCRLLGIESEMALRLLHKTQSAKNVGDLNTFLRDFMLDKPETFEVANRLVNEFAELNAAHQAVVTARQQVQTLAPARARHQQMATLHLQRNELDELRLGMNSYREQLRIHLLIAHLTSLRIEAEGLAGQVQHHAAVLENRVALQRNLEQQQRKAGGEQITALENEKSMLDTQRSERMRKRKQALDACNALGWEFLGSPTGFAALGGKARAEIEDWQRDGAAHEQLLALDRTLTEIKRRHDGVTQEVDSLRRQPSSIPAPMLKLRAAIAAAIGIAESALPFVGELIEVRPEEAQWRGAIERVLYGFAVSILVDESNYVALSSYINETYLGAKLIYFRTGRGNEHAHARTMNVNSLITKVAVKQSAFSSWLEGDLRVRFDYECVESLKSFRAASDRAMTREGLVKHSRARHEKNDRSNIDARNNWVLGFDNRDKLALFESDELALREQMNTLQQQIKNLRTEVASRAGRLLQCQTLVNLQWQEVDALPLADRIAAIDRQLASIRDGNTTLKAIDERLREQLDLVKKAEKAERDANVDWGTTKKLIDSEESQLSALRADPSIVRLTPFQRVGLDERFACLQYEVTLKDVDTADRAVGKSLNDDFTTLNNDIADCVKFIEAQFAVFIGNWKAEAEGIDATLASSSDLFGKLARLETDGLPAHEQRFFELLQNQSNQNLAALSTYLNDARKAILTRMELVNESLQQVPFNQSIGRTTYLQIQPKDRQLPEVRQFKQDILKALSHAWNDDPEQAEVRFVELRQLVVRLASQDTEQRRWREAVLDVRMHVEFIGKEYDNHGVEQEVHESGAGKSGGQRQKLATTVLAAALRYQLGGTEDGVPSYAPVVLDEAFDKADNEFTALAMNIFANFGFQMIVATPLKSVMTLEPFIGGACFVDIRDRRNSGVLLIEYDDEQRRLKLSDDVRSEAQIETAS
ncbi:MAG: ATP-binding protein [Massilia sp.]